MSDGPAIEAKAPSEAGLSQGPQGSSAAPAAESAEAPPAAAPAQPEAPPKPPEAVAAPPASELLRPSERAGALALLELQKVDPDASMKLRDEGDIDSLATSMVKLGQLFPVELRRLPGDRFQVLTGFRRIAALRLLKRERVLARVHTDLPDEDALRLALADLLEGRGAGREELVVLRDRLEAQGRLSGRVKETLERAIAPPDEALGPETVEPPEEEVDLEELTQDVVGRIAAVNQDLVLIAELWSALEPGLRQTLLEQLGYSAQLVAYLQGR